MIKKPTRVLYAVLIALAFLAFLYTGINQKADFQATDASSRPLKHFTVATGSQQDVTGIYELNNTFNVFYEFMHGDNVANTDWGHVTTTDFDHWQERAPAITPDRNGPPIFSGSAVVVKDPAQVNNIRTAMGLPSGKIDTPAVFLFYTCAHYILSPGKKAEQCLAYSLDGGKTFTKYSRPVIGELTQFARDPKVFWYPQSGKWIMVLALNDELMIGKYQFGFFESSDLINWKEVSRTSLAGGIDCPDFYPMKSVDGTQKWILSSGNTNYLIGDFDGRHFKPTQAMIKSDVAGGTADDDYSAKYCSQSIDTRNGRIQVGWMRGYGIINATQSGFPHQFTIPTRLTLDKRDKTYFIRSEPFISPKTHGQYWSMKPYTRKIDLDIAGDTFVTYDIKIHTRIKNRYEVKFGDINLSIDMYSGVLAIENQAGNHKKTILDLGDIIESDKNLHIGIVNDKYSTEVFLGKHTLTYATDKADHKELKVINKMDFPAYNLLKFTTTLAEITQTSDNLRSRSFH